MGRNWCIKREDLTPGANNSSHKDLGVRREAVGAVTLYDTEAREGGRRSPRCGCAHPAAVRSALPESDRRGGIFRTEVEPEEGCGGKEGGGHIRRTEGSQHWRVEREPAIRCPCDRADSHFDRSFGTQPVMSSAHDFRFRSPRSSATRRGAYPCRRCRRS